MRFVPLIFLILVACAAPPTDNEVTSRAIRRNCEAQGAAAADEVRQQSGQVVKEAGVTNQDQKDSIEVEAEKARKDAFKSCMLKYAV